VRLDGVLRLMSQHQRRHPSRELCQAPDRFGFEVVATRGGHAKLRRASPDGRRQTLTVPLQRELAPGTLRPIFRQACRFVREEEG